MAYTPAQIAASMQRAGFPASAIPTGVAIALAESGGAPVKSRVDPNSWGPWQINLDVHPLSVAQANNLDTSTRFAYELYQRSGWQPWSAYTTGAFIPYLNQHPTDPLDPGGTMAQPENESLLAQLTKQWGTEFGIDLGDDDEDAPKPLTTAGKINIMQDFAKVLADSRGGGPQATAVALSFLQENPELVSGLYSNYDIAAPEGMEKFAKVMFELERMGAMGTNLGQKAGSLSQSVTTRTLSPSEAESIFNLELKWQQLTKQAPLEAAKFLAPAFTPESFAGNRMPGFEEGGIYRQLLPNMNPAMFDYKPTPPGALAEITKMFQPDENEAMQMARAAMQNALRTGISSVSTTNTTSSGSSGAPGGISPSALMAAYFGMNPESRFGYQPPSAPMPGSPLSNIQLSDAGNSYPEALPMGSSAGSMLPSLSQQAMSSSSGTNPLAQAWSAATGPTNPIAQLFTKMGWR